jgi:DNA-binding transcriptional regulator of glucitol operon
VQQKAGAARAAGARVARAVQAVKVFSSPRWLVFHLIVWMLAVTMVLLGRWQLDVSNSKHFNWQNFGYSLQWWTFAAFGLLMWVRVMQHHLNPPESTTVSTGLVLASRGQLASRVGPIELAVPDTPVGHEPVVYRAYVMPQSSNGPVPSHGDPLHEAYNDYLWRLAMADGETPRLPVAPNATPTFDLGTPKDSDEPSAVRELRAGTSEAPHGPSVS